MAGLGDIFQKAVYLGVGLASYTGEKASKQLGELRDQAQTLADELVQRGEMTTEEARKMVDEMVQRSQAEVESARSRVEQGYRSQTNEPQTGPRTIEIEVEDISEQDSSKVSKKTPETSQADALRSEVEKLQEELQRLKRES